MAVNEAISHLRKIKKLQANIELENTLPLEGSERSDASFMEAELSGRIKDALDKLPEKCRIVFVMSRYEELSYKEIALQLEISVKTVENQIGKALRILRGELKDYLL